MCSVGASAFSLEADAIKDVRICRGRTLAGEGPGETARRSGPRVCVGIPGQREKEKSIVDTDTKLRTDLVCCYSLLGGRMRDIVYGELGMQRRRTKFRLL